MFSYTDALLQTASFPSFNPMTESNTTQVKYQFYNSPGMKCTKTKLNTRKILKCKYISTPREQSRFGDGCKSDFCQIWKHFGNKFHGWPPLNSKSPRATALVLVSEVLLIVIRFVALTHFEINFLIQSKLRTTTNFFSINDNFLIYSILLYSLIIELSQSAVVATPTL